MNDYWAHLSALPDSGGVVLAGRRWSTPQLRELALRGSADLARRGVQPGDTVVGFLPNGVEFVALWWACAHRGARFHPVNTGLRGDTLRYILGAAGPSLLIAAPDLARAAAAATTGGTAVVEATGWLAGLPAPATGAAEGPGGQVLFTSGTTGRPKGVVWSAATQRGHALAYSREMVRIDAGESAYACLPLFHVTAQGTTMATLTHGGTIHLDSGFPVRSFWQRIADSRAVIFPYVGSILAVLLKDERPVPPHRCRTVFGAAAPAYAWDAVRDRWGVGLVETYGQTELGGTWLMNLDGRAGSVGVPCPRLQARLAPRDADPDGAGELQVRPTEDGYFMSGYLDPEESAAAYTPDGWYRTRDVLALRADGYYRFVGRSADSIRRRGENVSAWEVEQAFLAHPGVLEAAAIGVPSQLGEEEIALYFVARPDAEPSTAQLRRWATGRLGAFMRPAHYLPIDALPKTQTQRVQKAALRDRFTGRHRDSG